MSNKNIRQKSSQIDISKYREAFSIISSLSKKCVYPSMPKRYRFKHLYDEIEIGIMYKRGDEFPQRLYFVPNGFLGYSFMSSNIFMGASPYNLEEILDYLYTPQQILTDFYLRLIKFTKNRKKKIKGLNKVSYFLEIILKNEDEFIT